MVSILLLYTRMPRSQRRHAMNLQTLINFLFLPIISYSTKLNKLLTILKMLLPTPIVNVLLALDCLRYGLNIYLYYRNSKYENVANFVKTAQIVSRGLVKSLEIFRL